MAKRITQLSELTTAAPDDYIVIVDTSTGTTKKITVKNLTGLPDFGWTATGESWSFSSYSSTTKLGVITVPSDATTKYTAGMLIRISQSTGGVKYGRIMSVTSTTLSVYFGSYTLNNEAISSPVYSDAKAPLGAPASITKDISENSDSATVATTESTTSGSFTDLATVGPSVTVEVGPSGKVFVDIHSYMQCSLASGNSVQIGFVLSGANTLAAGAPHTVLYQTWITNAFATLGDGFVLTGLNPGSTTFKMQYLTSAGTGTFRERKISVIPL